MDHVTLRARLNTLIAEREAAQKEENRIAAIAMRAIADAERNTTADNAELKNLIIAARGTAKCLAHANEKKMNAILGDIDAIMIETHRFGASLCGPLKPPPDVTKLNIGGFLMETPTGPAAAGGGCPKKSTRKSVTWKIDVPYDPYNMKKKGPVTSLRH